MLVASEQGKSDNTGWIIDLIHSQKECIGAAIEALDERLTLHLKEQKETLVAMISANDRILLALLTERDARHEQRFIAGEKAVAAAIMSAGVAVSKSEASVEKRFDAVNEFRNALGDQQRTLMPRTETEALLKNINEKVDMNSKRLLENASTMAVAAADNMSRGQGIHQGWAYALGAVTLISLMLGILAAALSVFKR